MHAADVTQRPRVTITHRVFEETLAMFAPSCDVVANQTNATLSRDEVIERTRDADALLAFMPDFVDREFVASCPKLRIVAGALRGYDNFDVAACTGAGIWLTIVPELLAGPTAELGIGLLLALARRIPEGDAFVRSGRFVGWRPHSYARGLAGQTVGILGFGQLGRAVARRLSGFEARVRYFDRTPVGDATETALAATYAPLDELLRDADYLVIALPLVPETVHLIDRDAIERMKPHAAIVNLGRGSVVDEAAVGSALDATRLGGYAWDVFEFEDVARADRPRSISPALVRDRERTVLTPHLGSAVSKVRMAIEAAAARNVLQVFAGNVPDGAVNRPARF